LTLCNHSCIICVSSSGELKIYLSWGEVRLIREEREVSNMSYCRFENTVKDLEDCINNFDNFDIEGASKVERESYFKFIQLIKGFTEDNDLDYFK